MEEQKEEKEENKNRKLIFIRTGKSREHFRYSERDTKYLHFGFYVVDANREDGLSGFTVYDPLEQQDPPPPMVANLNNHYATAVLGSKIFFLGGELNEFDESTNSRFSNTVFAFDTETQSWLLDGFQPMQTPRAYHTAVTVGSKIYVFGARNFLSPKQHWGERYDSETNTWEYLPQPSNEVYNCSYIKSSCVGVAYKNQKEETLILMGLTGFHSCSFFNTDSGEWGSFSLITTIDNPGWSERVAMVDHVLFWHHRGTVYGYDLMENYFVTSFTFKDPHLLEDVTEPTFVVHGGEGRICLVWTNRFVRHNIHCANFRFRGRNLVWETSFSVHNPNRFTVEDVIVLPSPSSSTTTGFSFGASSAAAASAPMVFASTSLGSSPATASNPPVVGSVFGQPANSPPPSNFVFPFQFGSQPNLGTPQTQSPFQPSGNLEFSAGGSFSLGTGGGDKSNRKFVKIRRDKSRKR